MREVNLNKTKVLYFLAQALLYGEYNLKKREFIMNKKMIAIVAAMMVLTGSMAFAASDTYNNQMPMNHYSQQDGNYGQHGRHGQHMYRLSDQAKTNSTSMWDSMCNFFGMHGGHGSHGGYGHRNHSGYGHGNHNGYGGHM